MQNKYLLNFAMNITNLFDIIYVLGCVIGFAMGCYYIAKIARYFVIGG